MLGVVLQIDMHRVAYFFAAKGTRRRLPRVAAGGAYGMSARHHGLCRFVDVAYFADDFLIPCNLGYVVSFTLKDGPVAIFDGRLVAVATRRVVGCVPQVGELGLGWDTRLNPRVFVEHGFAMIDVDVWKG